MLTLFYHPFASFCQKVVIAFYEKGIAFTPHLVDLQDPLEAAAYMALWPVGKMPLLHDAAAARTIPESSIIIEYLDRSAPSLIPADPDRALEVRLRDRFYDLYVQAPMQAIVFDRLRPPEQRDPLGVAGAVAQLGVAYDMIEREMAAQPWATGDAFTMADCAAAPALFYANLVAPFGDAHSHTAAYLARLEARPSVARVRAEAAPYFPLFPR